jgi:hypothetical protein
MRSLSVLRLAAVIVAVLGLASLAQATPITYRFSGTASGMLGGSPFTNVQVVVTGVGDTANVVPVLGGLAFGNPISTTTVTIAGLGSATVTDSTGIVSIPTPISIDTGFPVLPYTVIGTEDNPPDPESLTGLGVSGSNALLGYDLQTDIGPITGVPAGVGFPTSLFVHTTRGNLSFAANFSPTSEGTFSATVTPVPEPMSMLLLGSGVAVLAGRSRFRARARG